MKKRTYDNDYIQHCINDLTKWRELLKFDDKIDCIIEVLKDYKKFELEE